MRWFALLLACSAAIATGAAPRPNVVLIVADDLGYADVGFNGCEDIPTPNLDALAAGGVRFTNGYVTFPVCSPSRAGFITGRHQQRFGYERNPVYNPEDREVGLPLQERTLADTLGAAGYACGVIGKWHLGAHEVFHPLNRGFDEFFGFLTGGHDYFPENLTLRGGGFHWEGYHTMLERNREFVTETEYLTDALSREAASFVERRAGDPFFLYLAYNAPHTPMQAPAEAIAGFSGIANKRRRTYAAMVHIMDQGIGRVLDALDTAGVADNTLVFFLSDNGGATNNAAENGPLRGWKGDVFEGGLRVPFVARWPAVFPAGSDFDHPISSLDIYATASAQAGANQHIDPERPIDGTDLTPYLRGESHGPPHEVLFWRSKLVGGFAARSGDFKYVQPKPGEPDQLYNLALDIGESADLAAEQSERLRVLRERWEAWNAELIDPVFTGLESIKEYRRRWGR